MKTLIKYLRYFLEIAALKDLKMANYSFWFMFFKKLPDVPLQLNTRMGRFQCRENTTDFMYALMAYEYPIKQKILENIDKYELFLDIGACIGEYAVWMGKLGMKSYAFEPIHENYEMSLGHVKKNGVEDFVTVYDYGLGSRDEDAEFSIHPSNKGYSGRIVHYTDGQVEKVHIKTLDEVVEELNISPDIPVILKIDVEGMEADVLKGGSGFLNKVKNALVIYESHTNVPLIECVISRYNVVESYYIDELNSAFLIRN